jgi:hypothetical protein
MSTMPRPRVVSASAVVVLALLATSCGTPSNPYVPTGNPGPNQTVQTQRPGAQPTAPGEAVSGPEVPNLGGELPYRTPGDQPVGPDTVVVVPTAPQAPTVVLPDVEPTPSTEPSEQLPVPEVP